MDAQHQDALDKTGFWGKQGAGCIFFSKRTQRFLIQYRSSYVLEPHTWGTWGGAIDEGEAPQDAVRREVDEEVGYVGRYDLQHVYTFEDDESGFRYHNFVAVCEDEFEPILNWEADDYEWCEFGDWPEPLHYGLADFLYNAGHKLKLFMNMEETSSTMGISSTSARPGAMKSNAAIFLKCFDPEEWAKKEKKRKKRRLHERGDDKNIGRLSSKCVKLSGILSEQLKGFGLGPSSQLLTRVSESISGLSEVRKENRHLNQAETFLTLRFMEWMDKVNSFRRSVDYLSDPEIHRSREEFREFVQDMRPRLQRLSEKIDELREKYSTELKEQTAHSYARQVENWCEAFDREWIDIGYNHFD